MSAPRPTNEGSTPPRRGRVFGLTGGIASGKSLAGHHFEALGVPVIDTDAISRELVEPGGACLEAIRHRFGEAVLTSGGRLDRDALRRRILADAHERAALEAIMHPAIRREARRQAREAARNAPYVLVVVPLLAEPAVWSAYRDWLDGVITLVAPLAVRRDRLLARPGLDAGQADALIAAQVDDQARRRISDHTLDNSGSPEALRQQIDALDRMLRRGR